MLHQGLHHLADYMAKRLTLRHDDTVEAIANIPKQFTPKLQADIKKVLIKMNQDNIERTKDIASATTRILTFKYLGPTNHRGARVKISDPRFKKSKTIPYNYIYNSSGEVAVDFLLVEGWKVASVGFDANVIIMSEWDADQQLN